MRKISFIFLPIIGILASAMLFGTGFAAWAINGNEDVDNAVRVDIQDWDFGEISDSAHIVNVSSTSNLSASQETALLSDYATSIEAIKLTNTAGASNVDHSVNVTLDKNYTLGEIATSLLPSPAILSVKLEPVRVAFLPPRYKAPPLTFA